MEKRGRASKRLIVHSGCVTLRLCSSVIKPAEIHQTCREPQGRYLAQEAFQKQRAQIPGNLHGDEER